MFKKMIIVIALCTSSLFCMDFNIKNLTLEQKIGQLFMVAAVADETIAQECIQQKPYKMDKDYVETLIRRHHIGGIIFLGKSDVEKQAERTRYFQAKSTIPLLIGQDLEPGRVGAARFPTLFTFANNKTLGEINDTKVTRTTGQVIGQICKELGVHINFAPVADVNNNLSNPVINDRSFSSKPHIVAEHSIAFDQGLAQQGVLGCAKHFPGHGDTDTDSHHNLPVINHNKEHLHAIELYPFKKLIDAKIVAIMVAHICIPALESQKNLPASLSKAIVTDLLHNEMGFKGLIITDALDMGAITKAYTPGEATVKALCAGNDILLCPVDVKAAINAIKKALIDNMITEADIDMHVEKILNVKQMIFGS